MVAKTFAGLPQHSSKFFEHTFSLSEILMKASRFVALEMRTIAFTQNGREAEALSSFISLCGVCSVPPVSFPHRSEPAVRGVWTPRHRP